MDTKYEGQYDNLLFFFCFMYQKIKGLYDGGKSLKAYNKTEGKKTKKKSKETSD